MLIAPALIVLTLGPGPLGQPRAPASAAADYVTIDGRKQPSALPEWLVWEHGFTVLAGWAGKESGLTHDLKDALAPQEFARLEREALAQHDRGAEAARAIDALRPVYERMDQQDPRTAAFVQEKTFEINLKYRRATLEARDRLLAAFSPAAQAALAAWMNDGRASIAVTVPKGELARWRAPE